MRLYNNHYWALRVFGAHNTFNGADIVHDGNNVDPADWRSGVAVFVGSYADGCSFDNFAVRCSGGAGGLAIGDTSGKVLGELGGKQVGFKFNGHLTSSTTSPTNYGVSLLAPMVGAEMNVHVDGFTRGLRLETPITNFDGCRFRFWGPSGTEIWARNQGNTALVSAGTFGSPTWGLLDANQFEFIYP
jgi:hypothetical protein